MSYLTGSGERVSLELVVQPRASRTRLVGEHDGRLKVQLAAPPVDGEANAELLRFLAELFGVKRGCVELAQGERGKRKRVVVEGHSVETAQAAIDEALARGE